MPEYEITFIIGPVSEQAADKLLDDFDCIVGTTHFGEDFITMTSTGSDGLNAARGACEALSANGVHVRRAQPDLLTRSEVADRLDLTPQAVGNYVRGERLVGTWPTPYHEVAGGVWLWGDLVAWSRSVRKEDPAHGLEFLSRADYDEFNAHLERSYKQGYSGTRLGAYIVELPRTVRAEGVRHGVDSLLSSRVTVTYATDNRLPSRLVAHSDSA